MIHFDFMLDAEDAELLFDCVQQEINKLKAACLNFSFDPQLVFCNQVGQVITLPTWAIQDLFNI